MTKSTLTAVFAAAALSSTAFVYAEAPTTAPAATAYPLNTCLISKEPLGGDMGEPVVTVYKGQEMKFCCSSCLAKFKKDPDKYLNELHEAEKSPTTAPAK